MHAGSWRSSVLRWVALLGWALAGCATPGSPPTRLLLAGASGSPTARGESTGQPVQRYTVPGRSPASQMPWEFFLGHERVLRPDITDVSIRHVFEIKPWNEAARQEGQQEVQTYLAAMNRALRVGRSFSGGVDFHGEMLIRFAQGQYIWRLEWRTTEPGVTQYRWTRSQQRFESAADAADAGQWVNLTEEEMRQYGGWVGQAVEGMVSRRERLATVSGAVGLVIDILGEGAKVIITGVIFSRMTSGPGAWPPAQGGGQVIPFPMRPVAPMPPAQLPAAAISQ
jgi:hypothetical protein